jgi:putative phage-type endonuclease
MPEVRGLEQGTPEWLAFRRHLRMASETPGLLGLNKYCSPERTITSKVRCVEVEQSPAMAHGHEQEPLARDWYNDTFGELMRPAVYQLGQFGASLDGINLDGSRILEVKSPWKDPQNSERYLLAQQGNYLEADYAQVQHQLYVSEARACDLLIWDWTTETGLVVEILPDMTYWQTIWKVWNRYEKELSECSIKL